MAVRGKGGVARERARVSAIRGLLDTFARDCRRDARLHARRGALASKAGEDKRAEHHRKAAMLYRSMGNAYALPAARMGFDSRFSSAEMKALTKALQAINRR